MVIFASPLRAADAPATTQTTQPASFTRRADVIYGRSYGTALTMDVLTPKAQRNGAGVILVVSGGWVSSPDSLNSPFVSIFYTPFIERGFVVFAVVHGSQPKFTIPEIRLDLNRAVRYIRAHAADWKIDPDRLGITGGSAGGHLSLLQGCGPLAPDKKAKDPVDRVTSNVQAVACLFPPTDFLNWGEKNKNVLDMPSMKPFVAALDFHEMDEKSHMFQRIVDRPRVAAMEKEISPIYHVSGDSPPTLIIHGDADSLVPIQQAQLMIDKLKEANVPAELIVKAGAGHGWLNAQPDLNRMAEWFDTYLVKQNSSRGGSHDADNNATSDR
jgi:acetyl esterase/lipase